MQKLPAMMASIILAVASIHANADTSAIDAAIQNLIQQNASATPSKVERLVETSDYNQPSLDLSYGFSAYNSNLILKTSWKKTAEFPNPAQGGVFDSKIYRYSQDGVSINSTKDYIEIKADSFDKVVMHLDRYKQTVPLLNQSGWIYPNIMVDPYSYSFAFNLRTFDFYGPFSFSPLKTGAKLSALDVNTGTVIGYRIDNGELKPVLHDFTIYDYSELKDADHFMIYAKAGDGKMKLSAAAIEVNKSQGKLKVYRNYPFPRN